MKKIYSDTNICENIISISKELYIATVNENNTDLSLKNECDDSESIRTLFSIETTYSNESIIPETDSELTYSSLVLENLQFFSLGETFSESIRQ